MDCKACKEYLQAYLDGELDGDRFAEIEHHLGRCPECKAELDRLVRMRDLLRDLREVEVPPGEREAFIDALRKRIEAEQTRIGAPQRRINWRPALVASIAVVALMIVLVFIPLSRGPVRIAPAPGFNELDNRRFDLLITGELSNYFLATQGDLLADPVVTDGQILTGWKVLKDTQGDILSPAEGPGG
jgi:hypothetical protein